MDQNDIKNLSTNDKVFLGAGILLFILSLFLPYYGYSVDYEGPDIPGAAGFGSSDSTSAWHSWGTFALILLLLTLIVGAAVIFARDSLPDSPVAWNVIVLGLAALGALIFIIRSFTYDSDSTKIPGVGEASYGLKWGAYVLMILAVVQAVFAFLRTKDAGDAMPWENRGTTTTAPPAA
jgi:hypothetical protein